MKITTRTQLKGYGLSDYQATAITRDLTPIGKEGRSNTYSVCAVIVMIEERLKNPKIKADTKKSLTTVLDELQKRINNVTPVFVQPSTDPELSRLARKAYQAMQKADAHLADSLATAATHKGKNVRKSKQKVVYAEFGN